MQTEDFVSDEFLKQFKTGELLTAFLAGIQKCQATATPTSLPDTYFLISCVSNPPAGRIISA